MYKSIFDKSRDGMLITENGIFTECNDAIVEMLGYTSHEELLNLHPSQLSPQYQPDGTDSFTKANMLMDICLNKGQVRFEWVQKGANGEDIWTDLSLTDISSNGILRILGISKGIGTQKAHLKETEDLNKKLEDSLLTLDKYVISLSVDLNGVITEISEAFSKISQYSKEDLIGKNYNNGMEGIFCSDMVWNGTIENIARDGSSYWIDCVVQPVYNEENEKICYKLLGQDITSRHNEKIILETMAYYDLLTKIYNRQMFNKLLVRELKTKKRNTSSLSLIMLDIDHFKNINDTYGHEVGDNVLVSLSELISSNLRETDIFARWGGEEFIILLPTTNIDRAYNKAEELRKIIADYKNSNLPSITMSFGVTEILDSDKEQSAFIRVDKALYKAKIKRNDVVQIINDGVANKNVI